MGFKVLITEDFERMSEAAARILIPQMRATTVGEGRNFNLGLATGNSPTGLYARIAERQGMFEAAKIKTWSLDEYAGLPGEHASARALHPESYAYFMIQNLFGKLNHPFARTHIPPGTEIDQKRLEEAIAEAGETVTFEGSDNGKAVVISPSCTVPYLSFIRDQLMASYVKGIADAGGIDSWVVGVGGRGHIAFHESGIPLGHQILLVRLDDNTVENAVKDGHFKTKEDSPRYALSMGAGGVVEQSKNVLLLAYGARKTGPIAESLLGPETSSVPISILQRYASQTGRNATYILDEIAAGGILGNEAKLSEKGISVKDIRA
ncbi:6-phosphogluconolactonase [Candidatus Woesearchaeota archaeon]|nr:6-phosphogluconolactonase [Candidatus Woesearchaeota archaeon]